MHNVKSPSMNTASFELRFKSLFDEGRAYSFPCDESGKVDLDALSERAKVNYLYTHAVVGRDLSLPAVHRRTEH